MKKFAKILAVTSAILITLIVSLMIFLSLVVDPNDFKGKIAAYIEEKTGRQAVFEGDIGFSFFPWLGLELGHVSLGNEPGFGEGPFARVESAKIKVKVLPFLRKKLIVDTFSLRRLEIHLKRNERGQTNWGDILEALQEGKEGADKGIGWLRRITLNPKVSLSGIGVKDARVVWDDQEHGNYAVLSNINLSTGQVVFDEPFELNLAFNVQNRRPRVKGHVDLFIRMGLDSEAQTLHIEKTALAVQVAGKSIPSGQAHATLMAAGSMDLKENTLKLTNLNIETMGTNFKGYLAANRLFDKPSFKGRIQGHQLSLETLLEQLGKGVPKAADPRPPGKVSVDLVFESSAGSLDVKKLEVRLDDGTIRGRANISNIADPQIGFDLTADHVDLNRYLPRDSITELKRKGKQGKKGVSPREPGDSRPFLKLNGKLRVQRLIAHDIGMKDLHTTVSGSIDDLHLQSFETFVYPAKRLTRNSPDIPEVGVKGDLRVNGLFEEPALEGNVSLSSFNPREFMAAMDRSPPLTSDPTALGKASADLEFNVSGNGLELKKLLVRLDGTTIEGQASIRDFSRPEFAFDLTADTFDMDRYLAPKSIMKIERKGKLKNKDLNLRKAAYKVRGGFDFKRFRDLGLDGHIQIGRLKIYNLRMSDLDLNVNAHKGIIHLHPLKASLYKGSYSGDMSFDLHGDTAEISTKEQVKGIQVGPLFRDLIGEAKLNGTADVSVRITTKGTTHMALRRALSGKVSFHVADGFIRGYKIPGSDSGNGSDPGAITSKSAEKKNSTIFSEVRGTLWIRNGVARNHDFRFSSSSVKVTGKGHANLVTEELDYLLYLKMPSKPTFPIRIQGPFSSLETKLEVGEMVRVNLSEIGRGLLDTFKKSKNTIQDIGDEVRGAFEGLSDQR